MRSAPEIAAVLELAADGRSASEISRLTGIPRATVRGWISGHLPKGFRPGATTCHVCGGEEHRFFELPVAYAYLLGMYLGDGCISTHRRGVHRLRIALDLKYPEIIRECEQAIREVMPTNKIGRQKRRSNFLDSPRYCDLELSCYSKAWPCLFPQHGAGKKHARRIELVEWQREIVARHPKKLIRGLIQSDGCRFMNTGTNWRHPRYSFSNLSDDIRSIFCDACDLLGLHWTTAPNTVYISRVADVAALDKFVGPKR